MFDYKSLNLSEDELDELEYQLGMRKSKKIYEKNIAAIEENKKYIGKCFKEKNKDKYIMVLSSKSSNIYRLDCMCFEFPIKPTENHRMTKMFMPENAFSTMEFDSIYIEDYPLLCTSMRGKGNTKVIQTLIPITEEEYFAKMREFVATLEQEIKNGTFNSSKNNKSMFRD